MSMTKEMTTTAKSIVSKTTAKKSFLESQKKLHNNTKVNYNTEDKN